LVNTDINKHLTDVLNYLAESSFKEDPSSIVLSIGSSDPQDS
jgi:hypothetical protein